MVEDDRQELPTTTIVEVPPENTKSNSERGEVAVQLFPQSLPAGPSSHASLPFLLPCPSAEPSAPFPSVSDLSNHPFIRCFNLMNISPCCLPPPRNLLADSRLHNPRPELSFLKKLYSRLYMLSIKINYLRVGVNAPQS